MAEEHHNGFVAFGRQALIDAARPRIEREVRAEFADRLEIAGPLARLSIESKIAREIERRLKEAGPPHALY